MWWLLILYTMVQCDNKEWVNLNVCAKILKGSKLPKVTKSIFKYNALIGSIKNIYIIVLKFCVLSIL